MEYFDWVCIIIVLYKGYNIYIYIYKKKFVNMAQEAKVGVTMEEGYANAFRAKCYVRR